ncbi:hypothetical protein PAHAL_4G194000 [Panicum hallii]|uniref:Uncharacterized protein n=1 Tax=Panicum hallii TaxID=206008 RepID=A0A270R4C6_9POAL|nr:hypothetical protein PAHAL_4G194000 [Panicum hallii]
MSASSDSLVLSPAPPLQAPNTAASLRVPVFSARAAPSGSLTPNIAGTSDLLCACRRDGSSSLFGFPRLRRAYLPQTLAIGGWRDFWGGHQPSVTPPSRMDQGGWIHGGAGELILALASPSSLTEIGRPQPRGHAPPPASQVAWHRAGPRSVSGLPGGRTARISSTASRGATVTPSTEDVASAGLPVRPQAPPPQEPLRTPRAAAPRQRPPPPRRRDASRGRDSCAATMMAPDSKDMQHQSKAFYKLTDHIEDLQLDSSQVQSISG